MQAGRAEVSDVGRVEAELAEIWRSAADEGQPVIRACSMNLVVVCADGDEDVRAATQMIARISETAPGRVLMVVPRDTEGTSGLSVFVSAHCHLGSGGKQVCSEQITLEAGSDALSLVPGTVLQLLVEDLPVYTWWRRPRLADEPLHAPLRELSDRFIVNGAGFANPATALRELSGSARALSRTGQVEDLIWATLEPWREALASFFDDPRMRPQLDRISSVRLVGGGSRAADGFTVAAAYLAGWLASRLGWTAGDDPRELVRSDGGRVRLELDHHPGVPAGEIAAAYLRAGTSDVPVEFAAERTESGSPFVRLWMEADAGRPPLHTIQLPERGEVGILCGMFQRGSADLLFQSALPAAARMARP